MKQEEIKAFQKFKAAIDKIEEEDPGGAYLTDLVSKVDTISRNIQDDFPWETGLYVSQDSHDASLGVLESQVNDLKAVVQEKDEEIMERKSWDIRVLLDQMQKVKERIQDLDQEKHDQEIALEVIQERLRGGSKKS